jgi:glycosyltransferase involved in cell wall biosynthesis
MNNRSLSITFVLPGGGYTPVGGFKVVYEYANALVRRGHRVTIVHPQSLYPTASGITKLLNTARFIRYAADKRYRPDAWFQLDSRVRLLWRPSLHGRYIPDADCVVATAWETAEWVATYPERKGKKFYFVQDYERYMSATDEIKGKMSRTYNLGMFMSYISPAVRDMVQECGGVPGLYLPNGIDFQVYSERNTLDSEDRCMVGFPFRDGETKGTEDAIGALEIVQRRYPNIKIWSFGTKPSSPIPAWIDHYELPSDTELSSLYNRTKIFILPSHYEGWGLPACEAMACGSALVTTDNGGCHAYALDKINSLIAPPRMPNELAERVMCLLENEDLRINLARKGNQDIQHLTWDASTDRFEAALRGD